MKKLPSNIEELFDRAIEARNNFDDVCLEYNEYSSPRQPETATIAEWNECVTAYNAAEKIGHMLWEKRGILQGKWDGAERALVTALCHGTDFCYQGYKIRKTYCRGHSCIEIESI